MDFIGNPIYNEYLKGLIVDFTREPIIETVITPKEGCKIVVRSSKNVGQEEYFVDALEVVSFGKAMFFRSLEKPKAFLVPANDYEILEVREARMVLKNVGMDRSIKIGGGREAKVAKEPAIEKAEPPEIEEAAATGEEQAVAGDGRTEKKRDRRRQQRRRRGREEVVKEEVVTGEIPKVGEPAFAESAVSNGESKLSPESITAQISTSTFISTLLPPPPTLISETIGRYKENVLFKNAFYTKEESEGSKSEEKKAEGEEKKEETLENLQQPISEDEKGLPTFASFWDDITEPTMPPIPFSEKTEGEESSSTPEENKE